MTEEQEKQAKPIHQKEEVMKRLMTVPEKGRLLDFYPNHLFLAETRDQVINAFWYMAQQHIDSGFYWNDQIDPPASSNVPLDVQAKMPKQLLRHVETWDTDRASIIAENEAMDRWWDDFKLAVENGKTDETKRGMVVHLTNQCPRYFCCDNYFWRITYTLVDPIYESLTIGEDEEE